MDEKTYPVTMSFNDREIYGVLKVVGVSDDLLSQCTINPAYIKHDNGTIEIISFSIIPPRPKARIRP